jgi:hypothetical protein
LSATAQRLLSFKGSPVYFTNRSAKRFQTKDWRLIIATHEQHSAIRNKETIHSLMNITVLMISQHPEASAVKSVEGDFSTLPIRHHILESRNVHECDKRIAVKWWNWHNAAYITSKDSYQSFVALGLVA